MAPLHISGPTGKAIHDSLYIFIPVYLPVSLSHPDIDECAGKNDCSRDARCMNVPGTYQCVCKKGFRGDGKRCTGVVKNRACSGAG